MTEAIIEKILNTENFNSKKYTFKRNDGYLVSIYKKSLEQWKNDIFAHHLEGTKAIELLLKSKLFDVIVTKHRISNNNNDTLLDDIINEIENLLCPKVKISDQKMIENLIVTEIYCSRKEMFKRNDVYLNSVYREALQKWKNDMTETLESLLESELFDIILIRHRISNNNSKTLIKDLKDDIENLLKKYDPKVKATGDYLNRLFYDEQRNWQKNGNFSTRNSALASLRDSDLYHVVILRRAFTMETELSLEQEFESLLDDNADAFEESHRIKTI